VILSKSFRDRIDVYAVIQYKVSTIGMTNHYEFYSLESIHLTPQSAREEADRLKIERNNEKYDYQIQDVELKR